MPTFNKSLFVFLLFLLLAFFSLSTAFSAQESEVHSSTMAGILSIGPDGNLYIQFTKSHVQLSVGKMIMGEISEDLTVDQADQQKLQKAAYITYNAWRKCQIAQKKAADGKIPLVQSEFECARYRLHSADEALAGTTAILNNNLGSEIDWAKPVYEISKIDLANAKKDEQTAIKNGAVPTEEGYEPPGGTTGLKPPINISDPDINRGKYILDAVPIRDAVPASAINPNQ